MRLPRNAGCDTSAAIEAPATTMLATCAMVTMLERRRKEKYYGDI
jgi:hypothetical protein